MKVQVRVEVVWLVLLSLSVDSELACLFFKGRNTPFHRATSRRQDCGVWLCGGDGDTRRPCVGGDVGQSAKRKMLIFSFKDVHSLNFLVKSIR
jgi:hypothetical protein